MTTYSTLIELYVSCTDTRRRHRPYRPTALSIWRRAVKSDSILGATNTFSRACFECISVTLSVQWIVCFRASWRQRASQLDSRSAPRVCPVSERADVGLTWTRRSVEPVSSEPRSHLTEPRFHSLLPSRLSLVQSRLDVLDPTKTPTIKLCLDKAQTTEWKRGSVRWKRGSNDTRSRLDHTQEIKVSIVFLWTDRPLGWRLHLLGRLPTGAGEPGKILVDPSLLSSSQLSVNWNKSTVQTTERKRGSVRRKRGWDRRKSRLKCSSQLQSTPCSWSVVRCRSPPWLRHSSPSLPAAGPSSAAGDLSRSAASWHPGTRPVRSTEPPS